MLIEEIKKMFMLACFLGYNLNLNCLILLVIPQKINIYFIFLSTVTHKITHDCTITRFTYYRITIICSSRNNVIYFVGEYYF
jgi:hypothetical protein